MVSALVASVASVVPLSFALLLGSVLLCIAVSVLTAFCAHNRNDRMSNPPRHLCMPCCTGSFASVLYTVYAESHETDRCSWLAVDRDARLFALCLALNYKALGINDAYATRCVRHTLLAAQ